MKKSLIFMALAAGVLVLGAGFGFANKGQKPGAENVATTSLPLSEEARDALLEALAGPEGEYAAYATYTAIIEKFGNVEPYASIRRAEANHIKALQRQLERYGVPYPKENPYMGKISAPSSLLEAARAGVEGEIANVEMYDRLIKAVSDYPDLVRVFKRLRAASLERHLPAFKRALENGGTITKGDGPGGGGKGKGGKGKHGDKDSDGGKGRGGHGGGHGHGHGGGNGHGHGHGGGHGGGNGGGNGGGHGRSH